MIVVDFNTWHEAKNLVNRAREAMTGVEDTEQRHFACVRCGAH